MALRETMACNGECHTHRHATHGHAAGGGGRTAGGTVEDGDMWLRIGGHGAEYMKKDKRGKRVTHLGVRKYGK